MNLKNEKLLRELCNTPGVSGYEKNIQDYIKNELEKITDEIKVDKLGNVIALKKSKKDYNKKEKLKIMIAAHMDEIGLLIKHIDKDGFLRFIPIGGFDPRTLVAQRVIIHGKKEIGGIIAPRPPWLLNDKDKEKAAKIEDLFIDTGMSKEELSKYINIGDIVTLDREFKELNQNIVTGRNFDDRLGIYIMLEAIRRIKDYNIDIYVVATVQEEVGLRGSTVASFDIEPDIGIAIDGSLASDIPDVKEENKHCSLGEGTGIYLIDRLTISDKSIVDFLRKLAENNNIPYQLNIGGGTDAGAMQKTKAGVRVCTIGAPVRYMHSAVQLAHNYDIENTADLLQVFLENAHMIGEQINE